MQYVSVYTSITRSPKVFSLDDALFRFWINCLALAQDHDSSHGVLPDLDSIAFTLRLEQAAAIDRMTRLVQAGFIDDNGDAFVIHNWSKWRRKPDPTAAERKRRERARKKNDVTRDIRDASTSVIREMDARPSDDAASQTTPSKAIQAAENGHVNGFSPSDVTDVTRDKKCHAHITEQNIQNTPLPPNAGGLAKLGGEPSVCVGGVFVEPDESPTACTPAATERLAAKAMAIFEPFGLGEVWSRRIRVYAITWPAEWIDLAIPIIAGKVAEDRSTGDGWGRGIFQRWTQRGGPPETIRADPRASPPPAAPIQYHVCKDPQSLLPPAMRGKAHA